MRFNLPVTKKSPDGQALLAILLVVSVLLVVGLSAVSRSVTDIKTSQQSQEAARALWVAQAGLEEAVKAGTGISGSPGTSGITYDVIRTQIGEGSYFQFPHPISANESITFWLVNHNETTGALELPSPSVTQIQLGWSTSEDPALEATLIYWHMLFGVFRTQRYVYDANDSRRNSSTHFDDDAGSCTLGGTDFAHCSPTIAFPPNALPYLMHIKLLFNSSPQPVGVEVATGSIGQNFPIQGHCYDSTATVSESGITRRLQECHLWPVTPPIFDNLLWSGSDI